MLDWESSSHFDFSAHSCLQPLTQHCARSSESICRYPASALPKLAAEIHRITSQNPSRVGTPAASSHGNGRAASQLGRPAVPQDGALDTSQASPTAAPGSEAPPSPAWVPDKPEGGLPHTKLLIGDLQQTGFTGLTRTWMSCTSKLPGPCMQLAWHLRRPAACASLKQLAQRRLGMQTSAGVETSSRHLLIFCLLSGSWMKLPASHPKSGIQAARNSLALFRLYLSWSRRLQSVILRAWRFLLPYPKSSEAQQLQAPIWQVTYKLMQRMVPQSQRVFSSS